MRYPTIKDGDVTKINPKKQVLTRACCDCGLTHTLDFTVDVKGDLYIRTLRNNRATGQIRRHMDLIVIKKESIIDKRRL